MYNKISSGAVSYDVIIPSDYMIARMAGEGLLQTLNFDNIPNYQYIDDNFKGLYYDAENQYSVPYAYGIVGVIYDGNVVDAADANGWDLLWNEKYSNRILQFNNSRDAFGTAMYKLGIDVNTTDKAEWDRAYDELLAQRPLVYSYVMDEIFNMMESGEAAVGAYYAGDYFTMKDAQADNVDLQFYYPEKTNFYVDAMCIPTCAQNKELAEIFINYMLSEDAGVANAEYTYYASPNSLVYNNADYIDEMGEEAMTILYPEPGSFAAAAAQKVAALPHVTGSGREPDKIYISQATDKVLAAAEKSAAAMKDEYVSVEHVFLGLIEQPNAAVSEVLRSFGVQKNAFLEQLATVRGSQRVTSDHPEDTYDVLKKYGQDLVELARQQKLDPVIGRDQELSLIHI